MVGADKDHGDAVINRQYPGIHAGHGRSSSMRAVRYHDHGGPDVLGVDEIDRPDPEPDEILVEIRAASVNPVDTSFRSGEYGDVSLPAIPGGDGAGVVAAVGSEVEEFAEGDRIVVGGMGHGDGGTFAEYATIPRMKVAHLPESVSFEDGAAISNVGVTAWMALVENAGLKPTEYCLVHGGSGGVGHAAVQLGTAMGADVIATAGSEDAREQVRDLGAVAAFDYDSETLTDDVREETDGKGTDVILDHRPEDYLGLDITVAAQNGRIITITGGIPAVEDAPLHGKELTIRGMAIANTPERQPILRRLARLIERDDLTPVVADTFDFEEAGDAHRAVTEGGYVGKLVVRP
jgi:NADPH2:quinone reductase